MTHALSSVASGDWLRFLAAQRWFAHKGAQTSSARLSTVVPLPWDDGAFAICVVQVGGGGGERDHVYQIPVAMRESAPADIPASAVIARVDGGGRAAVVYDAVHDSAFRANLAAALAHGFTARSESGASWIITPVHTTGDAPPTFDVRAPSVVRSSEQSNTSVVFGEQAILKLFRTLQPGVHPDVEIAQYFSRHATFTHTPRLLSTIALVDEHGVESTAGMAQQFLAGSSDAWHYALERGHGYFSAPEQRDAVNEFVGDARRLGSVTREMHEALVDDDVPDFAPEPATPDDLDRWANDAGRLVRDSLALLERRAADSDFPAAHAAEAQALVRRTDHYLGWIDELVDEAGDDLGMLTRVHGDYHLGQVLRTAERDFVVIDFEGEPARSLADRRAKTSPLRDVAGMLRSFGYAAATLAATSGAASDSRTRELRAARWERDVRAAFLDGYLGGAHEDESSIIPEDGEHARALISLFETEKAFYELAYELNNRPAWVPIPMRGIAKLFTRT